MTKPALLLLSGFLLQPACAATLAAFHQFQATTDTSADVLESGFTATITQDLPAETTGGSTDTTYGTIGAPTSPANNGYARVTTAFTFTVTNGGTSTYQLDGLHFDSVSGNSGGSAFSVTYALSGGGGSGSIGGDTSPFVSGLASGSASDYADFNFTGAGITSILLAPGQTLTLTIDPTSNMRIDNLLLSGAVVPEPSAVLLALTGCGFVFRRRRGC